MSDNFKVNNNGDGETSIVGNDFAAFIGDYSETTCQRKLINRLKKIYGFDSVSIVEELRNEFGDTIYNYEKRTSIESMFIGHKKNKVYLFKYNGYYNSDSSAVSDFNNERFEVMEEFDEYIYRWENNYYIFKKDNKYIIYYVDYDVDEEEYDIERKEFDCCGIKIPGRLTLPDDDGRTITADINYNFLSLLDNEIYLNTVKNDNELNMNTVKIGKLPEDEVITRIEPLDNNRNDAQAFDLLFPHVALGLVYENGTKRLLIMKKDGSGYTLTGEFDNLLYTYGYYCRSYVEDDGRANVEAFPGLSFDYQRGDEVGVMEVDEDCNISYFPVDSVKESKRYNSLIESFKINNTYLADKGLNVLKSDSKIYKKIN